MLKNAMIFKIQPHWIKPEKSECETKLAAFTFQPCEPSQEKSLGFVPPRGHANGELVESIGSHWFFRVAIEVKKVPPSVVNEKLKLKVAEIEAATGRKPGKKEKRALGEEIFAELLPTAFPARTETNVWVDHDRKLLILDVASQAKSDELVSLLVKAIDLQVAFVQTEQSPVNAMTNWLLDQDGSASPRSFALGKELILKNADDTKAQVKYSHHGLSSSEIKPEIVNHIRLGKLPSSLELSHEKGVSFVLIDNLSLKKLDFSDAIKSAAKDPQRDKEDAFDADVFLVTSMLGFVLDDIVLELGGERTHA